MQPGKLFLIPSFLGEDNVSIIPKHVKDAVQELDEFIVENARSARRYLRAIGFKKDFDSEVVISELDKHVKQQDCKALLQNVLRGKNCGIISEAGNPCVADPGNEIVAFAHKHDIEIVPLVGPSSILLALISSGFNGQEFCFQGYLPIHGLKRTKKIKLMESSARYSTQIFMETPYRNGKLMDELLRVCSDETLLCIACDLTLSSQFIHTKRITDWKQENIDINKRYCIFLLGA